MGTEALSFFISLSSFYAFILISFSYPCFSFNSFNFYCCSCYSSLISRWHFSISYLFYPTNLCVSCPFLSLLKKLYYSALDRAELRAYSNCPYEPSSTIGLKWSFFLKALAYTGWGYYEYYYDSIEKSTRDYSYFEIDMSIGLLLLFALEDFEPYLFGYYLFGLRT